MTTKTIAERLVDAYHAGKEAIFYANDVADTGTRYTFTPSGLLDYIRTSIEGSSVIANTGRTSAFTFVLPAGYTINQVIITNNSANAVTGGLKFGSTLGGTDIVAAQAVAANATIHVFDSTLLKRRFGKAVAQTVYVDAVTAWNSANVDVDILMRKYV